MDSACSAFLISRLAICRNSVFTQRRSHRGERSKCGRVIVEFVGGRTVSVAFTCVPQRKPRNFFDYREQFHPCVISVCSPAGGEA